MDSILGATDLQKGLFVMIAGVAGVFIVLILFYFLIRVITRLFPSKNI